MTGQAGADAVDRRRETALSAIDDNWHQIRWVGNPKDEGAGSAELALPDGRGRARDFDNATIYWTPQTGAHEVHGDTASAEERALDQFASTTT